MSLDENTSVTEELKAKATDKATKIFSATIGTTFFAYSMIGFIADDTMSVNLDQLAASVLASRPATSNLDGVIWEFCSQARGAVAAAQRTGTLFSTRPECAMPDGSYAITQIHFVGYCHGRPFWEVATISHRGPADIQFSRTASHTRDYASGSSVVPNLARNGDERFAKYAPDLSLASTSLDNAARFAEAYIRLCSEPLAADVDPNCKMIGGDPQIAEVTPAGFRWRIPPKH